MAYEISRERYNSMFGPTTGDKVRLGDTELFIEIEKDYTTYGEESKFGGGKTLRDGMAQSATKTSKAGALDLVITNATILDYTGVVKADIGIKEGKIVGIGKAGNPDIQDGVDGHLVVGASTEAIAAEGLIVTAGGIDTHVHYITPDIAEISLESGVTTLFGGGTGPADGTNATTVTPGPWYIEQMMKAVDNSPINYGFLGKGNSSSHEAIAEQVRAGAAGLKLHEDWGSTPAAIDVCLTVCDEYDVQVAIHTDTLNEAGSVWDTIDAFDGRTIHTFHTEGAGGGHAPDIISVSGEHNVLPSSTNPTLPFTKNTAEEHLDMLMVCHHLDKNIEEDVAFADSRIRPETIGAEDVLHDMGIFSMTSSDAMAMGRAGEVVVRTWQVADKMKKQRGPLEEDKENGNDNFRAKRYIAKYTINPAVAQGISDYVGSVEVGKLADLVIWKPSMFASRPELILKSGMIAFARMGDPNASIPTPQPVIYRPQYAAFGQAVHSTSVTFVSQVSLDEGIVQGYGLKKKLLPVVNTRSISKKDMKLNDVTAKIEVDAESYHVFVNGERVQSEPIDVVPLGQRYNLF